MGLEDDWGGVARSNVLRDVLAKGVGRPWNDVYSELCAAFGKGKNTFKLREAVEWIVETQIRIINDAPYVFLPGTAAVGGVGDWIPFETSWRSWNELWVDPRDGILKANKKGAKQTWRAKYRLNAKGNPARILSDDKLIQYWKIKDIWYEVVFRDATLDECHLAGYNVLRCPPGELSAGWYYRGYNQPRDLWGREDYVALFGRSMIPIAKRQLCSAEIKKLVKGT